MRRFPHVFVLCTGRCGSTTFIHAAAHATNYTAGHETRAGLIGADRFAYPVGHIEADNRLSWMLGRMERQFGGAPLYVHLQRDRETTAQSFLRRFETGIMGAYQAQILMQRSADLDPLDLCRDYVDTVTANIDAFLWRKPHVLFVRLETAVEDFAAFWELVGAQGDLASALSEWDVGYNASEGVSA